MFRSRPGRSACAALSLLIFASGFAPADEQGAKSAKFPYPEKLTYRIEWRMMTAGTAVVQLSHGTPADWQTSLNLESAGLVTRLYRVLDTYKAASNEQFCASNSVFDAQEGKRHTVTRLNFDNSSHKVQYDERDLIKNSSNREEVNIAPCTYEIFGALDAVRETNLQPGKSTTIPITNGKKMGYVRIEAQAKEAVTVGGKTYQAIRYEGFLFDNVLYRRKGRLFIWFTDDPDRLPVQLRIQVGFPIGTIMLQLEKQEKF